MERMRGTTRALAIIVIPSEAKRIEESLDLILRCLGFARHDRNGCKIANRRSHPCV
jgi:hypothetical protein